MFGQDTYNYDGLYDVNGRVGLFIVTSVEKMKNNVAMVIMQ